MAGHHTTAGKKPLNKGRRIRRNGNGREHTQILCNTNARATRCLTRTEISVLTCVETTRARELHTCVKIQHYAAAVGHEIQIRKTR